MLVTGGDRRLASNNVMAMKRRRGQRSGLSSQAFTGIDFSDRELSNSNFSVSTFSSCDFGGSELGPSTSRFAMLVGFASPGYAAVSARIEFRRERIISKPGQTLLMRRQIVSGSSAFNQCFRIASPKVAMMHYDALTWR
jgi:uncharacterized protein YjbI with pentapeptide repeats